MDPGTLTTHASPCSIGVVRKIGVAVELRTHPVTPGYPVIFYPATKKPVSPELPQRILWTVHGLASDEEILIEKKPGAPHVFDWDGSPLVISYMDPVFSSGPPIALPDGSQKQTRAWVYTITLRKVGSTSSVVDLDPVVIIEPDPR